MRVCDKLVVRYWWWNQPLLLFSLEMNLSACNVLVLESRERENKYVLKDADEWSFDLFDLADKVEGKQRDNSPDCAVPEEDKSDTSHPGNSCSSCLGWRYSHAYTVLQLEVRHFGQVWAESGCRNFTTTTNLKGEPGRYSGETYSMGLNLSQLEVDFPDLRIYLIWPYSVIVYFPDFMIY